jgi:hypothetical protein
MTTLSKSKKQTACAAAAVAAVGSIAGSVLAPDALASHPSATCPGNTFCEWADGAFNGPVKWWGAGNDNAYTNNVYDSNTRVGLNDSVTSIWNNTSQWKVVYWDTGQRGDTICIAPSMASRSLTEYAHGGTPVFGTGNWNDEISSHASYSYHPAGCTYTINDNNHLGCSM